MSSSVGAGASSDQPEQTGQQPQIRILKRPDSGGNLAGMRGQGDSQQKQASYRSLEERAVAYAEARKRILGK